MVCVWWVDGGRCELNYNRIQDEALASSFAIILMRESKLAGCFTSIVFLMSCGSVSGLGAVGWSAELVCDCCISF